MDIRVLRYFLKICELGNISKAAESLHTTQPNPTQPLTPAHSARGGTRKNPCHPWKKTADADGGGRVSQKASALYRGDG